MIPVIGEQVLFSATPFFFGQGEFTFRAQQ